MACANCESSDQPVHFYNLIIIFSFAKTVYELEESNLTRGGILSTGRQGCIAHSLSSPPLHQLIISEILLKGP